MFVVSLGEVDIQRIMQPPADPGFRGAAVMPEVLTPPDERKLVQQIEKMEADFSCGKLSTDLY